ncbi:MAG: L-serine ammonia-lyase, partial [Mailhella sp.]|nr:L-serine ammonia-lyase [Mailhella sp.]
MSYITTSLFSLFKIGPGPSSSHTIGPMKAGKLFVEVCAELPREILARAARIRVRLFGSLSATGEGHGTDAAILAGLLGTKPEDCPSGLLPRLNAEKGTEYRIELGGKPVAVSLDDIVHDSIIHSYPYSNTLVAELLDGAGEVLFERAYYSVGGGFVQWDGWQAPELGEPVYKYGNMTELRNIVRAEGLNIYEIMLANEMAMTGATRPQIIDGLNEILDRMEQSVEHGLQGAGCLPGPLKVERKAHMLHRRAHSLNAAPGKFLAALNSYAFAASEENASGGVIVTAPTCGASGVMPALVYAMRHDMHVGDRAIREGFLAAAAVGFIAKHNASIAGAEVGCQGEVGVASAMAAAMLTDALGNPSRYVENAAEVALEHHLGITCDPVGGYVQIPCIERNAMGAVKAFNASLISTGVSPESQRVSL